jgi:hypothetical protein
MSAQRAMPERLRPPAGHERHHLPRFEAIAKG